LAPSVTFCYAQQWLYSLLGNSVLSEWEALALFVTVVNRTVTFVICRQNCPIEYQRPGTITGK
jgi:hypothetical protein